MRQKIIWKNVTKKILAIGMVVGIIVCTVVPGFALNAKGYLKGNSYPYFVSNVESDPDSPLRGKTIIYLGSSVTAGYGSMETSFVEYLAKKDGVIPIKCAVSGTTLVNDSETSYIARMELIPKQVSADAFFCQLSTNDATKKKPLGKVSKSFAKEDFDQSTVAGAIEYIIAYAKETWDCPVYFYTSPQYNSARYGKMVQLLQKIQKKWSKDVQILDLWNNKSFNKISDSKRELYMMDEIHPTKAGYLKWWLPEFEAFLTRQLTS